MALRQFPSATVLVWEGALPALQTGDFVRAPCNALVTRLHGAAPLEAPLRLQHPCSVNWTNPQ